MVISTKHKFVSPKPDGADATIVRATNWNDEHAITMATARLMGRATAGAGAVEEISLSADLAFSGTVLGLSPALSASIAGKVPDTRNVNTSLGIVGGGPLSADLNLSINISTMTIVDGTGFSNVNYVPVWNSVVGNGRIGAANFATVYDLVNKTRTVTAINGLFNGGDLADLKQNITVGMLTPSVLSSGTSSVAPTGSGHAHEINCLNVTSVGAGDMGYGTLGTECLMRYESTGNPAPGTNKSGALLRYSSAGGNAGGGTPPGSWTCHGFAVEGGAVPSTSTVWRRYA